MLLALTLLVSSCAYREITPSPSGTSWTEGNRIDTLVNGKTFYPAMLTAIRNAKRSITFETFAYVNAPITTQFTEALAQKAHEGVEVRIILDAVGSKKLKPAHLSTLKKAGAQVYLYRPFKAWRLLHSNNRTHRKILIIDGKTAFTGGAGFAHSWLTDWRDTQYRIQGPAVAQLQESFSENWLELSGETLKDSLYFPPLSPVGSHRAAFVSDTISNRENPLAHGVLEAIRSSRKSLLLEQSYFVPNATFRKALLDAAQRGVKIEIIVPGADIDSRATRYASQNHWRQYLESGIQLYQYEAGMLHGKLLISDGLLSIVGSGNLDDRSFFLNDEVNLHVHSRAFASDQERMFRQDLRKSRRITTANLSQLLAPWLSRTLAGFISAQL